MTHDAYEAWPFKDARRHFCSGVNAPGEVRGLSGQHVGIAADRTSLPLIEQLETIAGGPTELFIDSGAFGEVEFWPHGKGADRCEVAGRHVHEPITEAEWAKRLAVAARLAAAFRQRAFVVAPDAVGDQGETLARLERWVPEILAIKAHRANVIVALQRGELSAAAFVARVIGILGFADFLIGIPSRKGATTPEQLQETCRELREAGVETPRFHLLGMGPNSKARGAQMAAIRSHFPDANIYSDSVGVRSEVGRTNGPGKTPRRLTLAQDAARSAGARGPDVKAMGLALVGEEDRRAELQAARRAGWFDDELESAPGVPLEPGCIEYGQEGPFGEPDDQGDLFSVGAA